MHHTPDVADHVTSSSGCDLLGMKSLGCILERGLMCVRQVSELKLTNTSRDWEACRGAQTYPTGTAAQQMWDPAPPQSVKRK